MVKLLVHGQGQNVGTVVKIWCEPRRGEEGRREVKGVVVGPPTQYPVNIFLPKNNRNVGS